MVPGTETGVRIGVRDAAQRAPGIWAAAIARMARER